MKKRDAEGREEDMGSAPKRKGKDGEANLAQDQSLANPRGRKKRDRGITSGEKRRYRQANLLSP